MAQMVLLFTLVVSGFRVVWGTARGMLHGRFAADIVATLSILVAAGTGEFLPGVVIALMQTGGEALEEAGKRRASATLDELLARAPQVAHRMTGDTIEDLPVTAVRTVRFDVPGSVVACSDRAISLPGSATRNRRRTAG